ncbi:MAG: hypothetical protein ACLUFL_01530 [Flavonifractor plautii]
MSQHKGGGDRYEQAAEVMLETPRPDNAASPPTQNLYLIKNKSTNIG